MISYEAELDLASATDEMRRRRERIIELEAENAEWRRKWSEGDYDQLQRKELLEAYSRLSDWIVCALGATGKYDADNLPATLTRIKKRIVELEGKR